MGEVDGLVTRTVGQSVAVVTADCVPILLYHQEKKICAALHAGWRGTEKGIVAQWAQLVSAEGLDPAEFKALIGPSIRGCCYEVSKEVLDAMAMAFPMIDESQYRFKERNLDLALLNEAVLRSLGVSEIKIHPDCTFCKRLPSGEPLYFSYRRGDRDCRQYSSIYFDGSEKKEGKIR
jgi:YfiH family protein